MNTQIIVDYNAKTNRLMAAFPFFLADVARSFPSRRFDPKTKQWAVPITRANLEHLDSTRHLYQYVVSENAQAAIESFHESNEAVKYVRFPYHLYDFKKSATHYEPMEHQRLMLDKAWNLHSMVWFAKMGTGKTYAAIHLACARFEAGLIDAVMVICPSTLRTTWRKELAKYATVPYDYRIHETKGMGRFYAEKMHPKTLQILAVSVEGLGISESSYDSVCGFFPGRRVMIICDESSRIKSPKALRTQRAITLGACAVYKVLLNGTPIALGIQDLWSQYEFLDPNIIGMGDYWAFKTRYISMGGYMDKKIIGYQHVEELMSLIDPYTLEVGKEVLNLPPKVYKVLYCSATVEQKRLLRQIKTGEKTDPDGVDIKVDNVLERILRWRQVVGGWTPEAIIVSGDILEDTAEYKTNLIPLADNPKMDTMFEMIADHYKGSKFIIWSTFVHEIEYIATRLSNLYGENSVCIYYGKTDKETRSDIEDAYCNDPTMRFFVGNPASAGLGLTLISGEDDVMVYYSGTNAYIDRAQSEDRAHRIGQMNSVVVVDIVMERTVDEAIAASIAAKMNVETYILERLKAGEIPQFEG